MGNIYRNRNTSGYVSIEVPSNVPGIGYTLKHRDAVEALINYYCKKAVGHCDGNGVMFTPQDYQIMVNRGKCHDMDKVVCGLAYPQLTVDYFHRMFNGHHEENCMDSHSKYDWIEHIMDIESARYTKPDKGKCAYEAFTTFKADMYEYVKPYLVLFGFTKIEKECVPVIKNNLKTVYYEADLIEAIVRYMHTTHIHLLDGVSRLDDQGFMEVFNQPTPFRHPNTQRQGGTKFKRPSPYVASHPRVLAKEMVNGVLEAQVYDYDKLCAIPAGNVKDVNRQCLLMDNQLHAQGKHR